LAAEVYKFVFSNFSVTARSSREFLVHDHKNFSAIFEIRFRQINSTSYSFNRLKKAKNILISTKCVIFVQIIVVYFVAFHVVD